MRVERPVKTPCPACGSRTLYWWYIKLKINNASNEYGIYCSACGKTFPNKEEQRGREFTSSKVHTSLPIMTSKRVGEISFLIMMLTLRQNDVAKLDPEKVAEMINISPEELLEYMDILARSTTRDK